VTSTEQATDCACGRYTPQLRDMGRRFAWVAPLDMPERVIHDIKVSHGAAGSVSPVLLGGQAGSTFPLDNCLPGLSLAPRTSTAEQEDRVLAIALRMLWSGFL
jgi:hypothetical protein